MRSATSSNGSRRVSSIRTRSGSPPGAVSEVHPYADSMLPPYAIACEIRKTGSASCRYCSASSAAATTAPRRSTSSSTNFAPSSRASDAVPKATRVTLAPPTSRVLSTCAPSPPIQKRTAGSISGTGTVSPAMKRWRPAASSPESSPAKFLLTPRRLMSDCSCARSPNTYGSSGVLANSLSTSASRFSLSAIEPVGTIVYSRPADAGAIAAKVPAAATPRVRTARRERRRRGAHGGERDEGRDRRHRRSQGTSRRAARASCLRGTPRRGVAGGALARLRNSQR